MPIEIDFGEKLGKLIINHEKSLPVLLTDLCRDTGRIKREIEELADFKNSVKDAKGMLPRRILILKAYADTGETRLAGYSLITRELWAGEDGTLIEQITKRPLKHGTVDIQGIGKTNLEDETNVFNPKFVPEWLTRPKNEVELRRTIRAVFYSRP